MKRAYVLLYALILVWTACSTDADSNDDQSGTDDMPVVAMTVIPDANFEQALIDLDLDDVIDGFVRTASIAQLEDLVIEDKNISDLLIRNYLAEKLEEKKSIQEICNKAIKEDKIENKSFFKKKTKK